MKRAKLPFSLVVLVSVLFLNFGNAGAASAAPGRDRSGEFQDQVRQMGLTPDKKHFRVVFMGRAALYQAVRSNALIICLRDSALNKTQVKIRIDSTGFRILSCEPAVSSGEAQSPK